VINLCSPGNWYKSSKLDTLANEADLAILILVLRELSNNKKAPSTIFILLLLTQLHLHLHNWGDTYFKIGWGVLLCMTPERGMHTIKAV